MGRNMFGPVRGPWGDEEWKGWWGDNPPYHHDVFVLTHHAHDPIPMEGGTTFHFVTDGIESALEQALVAAGGQDVRIGGGAGTIRQYLQAGLIDELTPADRPAAAGRRRAAVRGPRRTSRNRYEVAEVVSSPRVAHFRLVRSR
jgi:dihydrofolate reductase